MEYEQALTADELWGWPVEVLDRLSELRQQAGFGDLSLEQWREQDAEIRQPMPTVNEQEIRALLTEWAGAWVDSSTDKWDAGKKLMVRLTSLAHPAPTDEELWQELNELAEALTERRQPRETREAYQKRCDRVSTWLIRSGFVDAASGLPWAQVARYRVIEEPELGLVPQYVDAARQAALAAASDQDQRRADLIRASPQWKRFAERFAELEQDRLTWLPRMLIDSDDEVTALRADLLRVWSHPRMQRLLLKETASGWPPPYQSGGTGGDG